MDLLPGPAGQVGQIILFGRDFDTKLVIASSLQEFLFGFVTDLEQGNSKLIRVNIKNNWDFYQMIVMVTLWLVMKMKIKVN